MTALTLLCIFHYKSLTLLNHYSGARVTEALRLSQGIKEIACQTLSGRREIADMAVIK